MRRWLSLVLVAVLTGTSFAVIELRQSTAVDVMIGPFQDPSTGARETALTINATDVYLSKNGAAWAAKNDSDDPCHSSLGWYICTLDATDTGTLGVLRLDVGDQDSNSVAVWHDFAVVTANVWDSRYSTDILHTSLYEIDAGGSDQTVDDLADFADTGYDPSTHRALADVNGWSLDPMSVATVFSDAFSTSTLGALIEEKLPPDINTCTVSDGELVTAPNSVDVQVAAAAALTAYDPPTNTEMEARTMVASDYFDPNNDTVTLADGAHGGSSATITFASMDGNSINIENESGVGVTITGTSAGMYVDGTAGSGIHAVSTGSNGSGLELDGNGTGDGLNAASGAGGAGAAGIQVSSASGDGITISGAGDGISSSGGTGPGLQLASTSDSAFEATAGTNKHGMELIGNGTGEGLSTTGGLTGHGMEVIGGGTSGDGLHATTTDGDGFDVRGSGNNHGIYTQGGGSGSGLAAYGAQTGYGIRAVGGVTSGFGIYAYAVNGDGKGIAAVGDGTGAGFYAGGGATGNGAEFQGGPTSGAGMLVKGNNANDNAMELTPNGSGKAIYMADYSDFTGGMTDPNGILNKLGYIIEADGADYRFDLNSLEQAVTSIDPNDFMNVAAVSDPNRYSAWWYLKKIKENQL